MNLANYSARATALRQQANASRHNFFVVEKAKEHFDQTGERVPLFLLARESGRPQAANGNLNEQVRDVKALAPSYINIVGVYSFVGSGKRGKGIERHWKEATRRAKECEAIGFIAESVARVTRSKQFNPNDRPKAKPTTEDFEAWTRATGGLPCFTLVHPDASAKQIKSHETKRGQRFKGNKGGRPKMTRPGDLKRRREECAKVLRLMVQLGCSLREMGQEFGVARSTAQGWRDEYRASVRNLAQSHRP